MNSRVSGDVSALLYLVPFAATGAYAILLWAGAGVSATLPSSVYLTVTRDPYLFMLGVFAVLAGMVLDVRGSEAATRRSKLASLGSMLQSMAAFSLVLVVISALYANGGNISGAANDILVGRYGLVFPAMLVLLSYLATADFRLGTLRLPKSIGVVLMLLVPAVIYEVGRRQIEVGLATALVFLVVGAFLFTRGGRKTEKPSSQ